MLSSIYYPLILYFNPLSAQAERRLRNGLLRRLATDFNPLSAQAERHCSMLAVLTYSRYFNPLSAQAERQLHSIMMWFKFLFQSTLRASRETDASALVAGNT